MSAAATIAGPVITGGKVGAYTIPTATPEADGTAEWDSTTIVVVELTAGGRTGLGFTYANEAAQSVAQSFIDRMLIGADAFSIPDLHQRMDRLSRNWGRPGLVSNAISAVDIALWDLKARLLGCSVLTLIGKARDEIPAYGSGGFTSYPESQLLDQLTEWAADGFSAVKMKIGRDLQLDLDRVSAVNRALHGRAELYVDANGAYTRKQALSAAEQFKDSGVTWFEEPVSSDDRAGLRLLVERAPACMNIAAGEYIYVLDDARLLLEAGAVDVLQVDVTRCGGPTNFLKIAAMCETAHLPLSAHTAPSLHASLCCAVQPAMNVEYFFDHQRIEHMLFDSAAFPHNGMLKPDASAPGFGLTFKRPARHGTLSAP